MRAITTRELARYATDQLMVGVDPEKVAKHVAAVLVTSNRSLELSKFNHLFEAELARRGVTQVTMTSALTLLDATKKRLAEAIGVKHAVFNEVIDESVVGGARVETAELLLDLTVKRKLELFTSTARSAL